jgi:hypothetical protein
MRVAQDYEGLTGEKELPSAIRVWSKPDFWIGLGEAELLIRPLVDASFLMQRDGNNMAHVFLAYLNLYRHVTAFGDNQVMAPLKKSLEKRWNKEEHPIFFLAFALHPAFRNIAVAFLEASHTQNGTWTSKKNPLSVARLKAAAVFYCDKFKLWTPGKRDEERRNLKKDLGRWLKVDGEFGQVELPGGKFKGTDNAVDFWLEHTVEHPGLANLAVHFLCCPVQSASCERLFKDYALFRTKARNRLLKEKYHKMA